MSYLVNEIMADYTDRSTGNRQIRAYIVADTAADLPANTTALTWLLGSYAKTVDTGDEYYINSSGSWILQPSSSAFSNVYTKAETDALLAPIDAAVNTQESSLVNLIDTGGKNRLKLSGSDVTGYGIQCTFDYTDGTIHLNGINPDKLCTGSFNIQIADSRNLGLIEGVTYKLSCDGYTTANDTIGIYVYTSGATPLTQFDSYNHSVAEWDSEWEQTSGFRLFIRSGTYVDNITLKPMISLKSDYDLSPAFEPYCPTLAELYALVRSYHP